jgi:hypothetical protein
MRSFAENLDIGLHLVLIQMSPQPFEMFELTDYPDDTTLRKRL